MILIEDILDSKIVVGMISPVNEIRGVTWP